MLLHGIRRSCSHVCQCREIELDHRVQEKKEEIKKLQAQQRGKAQQIENLENDHRARRKKLEARIERQTEKICTLEAQLSNRITVNQQASCISHG